MVGVEFLIDTHGPELKEKLVSNFEKHTSNQMVIDEVFDPIEKLRNKALTPSPPATLAVVIQ